MPKDQTIAVIGAGNIGRALIGGLLRGYDVDPSRIRATRRDPEALTELQELFPGIQTNTDNAEAVEGASVVVLAIKPQSAREVIESIRAVTDVGTLVVSVLAGLTTDALQAAFEKELAVVRAMPNTRRPSSTPVPQRWPEGALPRPINSRSPGVCSRPSAWWRWCPSISWTP